MIILVANSKILPKSHSRPFLWCALKGMYFSIDLVAIPGWSIVDLSTGPSKALIHHLSAFCLYTLTIGMLGGTGSYAWRHWFVCLEALVRMLGGTGSYAWRHWFVCLEALVRMLGGTGLYAWRHWFVCLEALVLQLPHRTYHHMLTNCVTMYRYLELSV